MYDKIKLLYDKRRTIFCGAHRAKRLEELIHRQY